MDTLARNQRSELMSRVGRKDTGPELAVRRLLHAMGCRYRVHRKDLPGTPDIVLPSRKLVIFVHGCFWHAHTCRAGRRPSSNVSFWEQKALANAERDKRKTAELQSLGWRVEIIWECETKDAVSLGERIDLVLNPLHTPNGLA